jgi:hypothetical protein
MKIPSKQPAVPAAFTTSLTHTQFSPTWHISDDVDPVTGLFWNRASQLKALQTLQALSNRD